MTGQLTHHDRKLLAAVAPADVMAAAGRMIARPWRANLSLAEQLAMSIALEAAQAALIEARLLLAALDLPERGREAADLKAHAVETQMHRLRAALAVLDGNATEQETDDAGSHS